MWDKIAPELQGKLLEIAREYSGKIASEVRRMDSDALKTMKEVGGPEGLRP